MSILPITSSTSSSLSRYESKDEKKDSIDQTEQIGLSKVCAECYKTNLEVQLCGRCKKVNYCNSNHQRAHWIYHKEICSSSKGKIKSYSTGLISRDDNQEDVVAFSSRRSNEYILKLKSSGYKGLKRLGDLENFLRLQKYRAVLKFLWSESSQSARIEFLEVQALRGHAILMLELCRELLTQSTISEKDVTEAVKWWSLGIHCTDLDVACNKDRSTEAAPALLKHIYSLTELIPKDFKSIFTEEKLKKINLEAISGWVPSSSHPSPQWVLEHGILSIINPEKSFLIEETKWLDLRTEKHVCILECLHAET